MDRSIEDLAANLFRDSYSLMENLSDTEIREIALLSIKAATIFHNELENVKNARIPVHILHEGSTAKQRGPTA